MWMRYATFAAPVLLVAALAAAIVLASAAGPQPASAAVMGSRVANPALPADPQATPTQPCENGTAVASPAANPGLVADCALLLAAKDTLRGTETLNWSADRAITSWEGISVGGSPRRVTRLFLDRNSSARLYGRRITLTGTIPAALGGLSKLQGLTLTRHELTGTIPAELGSLSELTDLQLYSNELTGGIPPELSNLSNLTRLALRTNPLGGEIPVELGKLSNLTSLSLENTQLTGSIPASLGDLQDLQTLKLYGNRMLTGCIPESLRGITLNDLRHLDLEYCTTTTTYALTTSVEGNGRISPLPGSYSYLDGASVTVTATPDGSNRIASWGGDCSGTASTCTLTMDANRTASITFERIPHTLTVTATGGGSVTPGTSTQYEGDEVTLTASWNDATHSFTGWGGDCSGTATTCVLTIDAAKSVTATFAALPADRCATTTAADCIRAVYRGAPGDYAQVADIPAALLLTPGADGRYRVERGEQMTVVTAAPLPTGWTRFYLEMSPLEFGTPSPVSFSQLIKPVGTTYTFTPTEDEDGATLITFDLKRARPFIRPRPDGKPEIGAAVVTTEFQVVSCESGFAVANPSTNAELVEDCEALLGLRDTLAGDAALNWTAGTAMSAWTGVTVGGTPQRVTGLSLANSGLSGELSGLLGDLTGLTELRLNGNSLTGMVPSKTALLTGLTHVYLAGNAFTGCVPPELRAVTNNDIATSGLADCGTPAEIGAGEHTLQGGTYTYTARIHGLPSVTFDVPAGVQLEISHLSIGAPTAEHPQSVIGLHLQDAAGTSRLCLEVQQALECGRLVADSGTATVRAAVGTPNLGTAFDRIVASVWTTAPLPADTTLKPHVARNVIIGESIVVCSPSSLTGGPPPSMLAARVAYPNAAQAAATVWNEALHPDPPMGRPVYTRHQAVFTTAEVCTQPGTGPSSDRLDYVRLYGETPAKGYACGAYTPGGDDWVIGCFTTRHVSQGPYFTFFDHAEIVLDASKMPSGHDALTVPLSDGFISLRNLIAHELGHVLGMDDILNPVTCMIDDGEEICVEPCTGDMLSCHQASGDPNLTARDHALYKSIYEPNRVTHATGLNVPYAASRDADDDGQLDTIRFTFSALNTIAEKAIEIRQGTVDEIVPGESIAWSDSTLQDYGADQDALVYDHPEDAPAETLLVYGIFVTTDAYLLGQEEDEDGQLIGFPRAASVVVGRSPPLELPGSIATNLLKFPVITSFSAVGKQATGSFTWTAGQAYEFLRWNLERAPAEQGDYEHVVVPMVQSGTTVTFGPLVNGWYRLSGRSCHYSREAGTGMELGQHLNCGGWGPFSDPDMLTPPPSPPAPPAPSTYTLSTSVSPPGWGSISVSPSGPYSYNDPVTLSATPTSPVYYFAGWGGDCSGRSSTCDLTMNGNKSATATFDIDCEPITGCGRRVNADEWQSGFTFKVNSSGSTASGAGERTETPLSVDVTIGDSEPLEVSVVAGEAGTWLVQVPANASFLTEGTHDLVVEWYRGEDLVASETTTIIVDLTAPSASYTAPTSLSVGTAVSISPSTTDTDIASYALKTGSSLPSGLTLDSTSGVVSGTPGAAAAARTVTIVVTDDAGNTRDVTLALPAVDE